MWCPLRDSSSFVIVDKNPKPVACECLAQTSTYPKPRHVSHSYSPNLSRKFLPSLQYITLEILTLSLPLPVAADHWVRTQICPDSVKLGC